MTIEEFFDLVDAWKWREEYNFDKQMRIASIHAAWTVQPHSKKKLKPTDFYDPKKEQKTSTTPEESQQVLDELVREMDVD